MPARSPSSRSQEPRDRDDLFAAAPARAVGKETRDGDRTALARKYWQEHEWSTALMKELRAQEATARALGGADARLSRVDVLEAVEKLRRRFDIQDREIAPYRDTND